MIFTASPCKKYFFSSPGSSGAQGRVFVFFAGCGYSIDYFQRLMFHHRAIRPV
jgi:hypothetical protein